MKRPVTRQPAGAAKPVLLVHEAPTEFSAPGFLTRFAADCETAAGVNVSKTAPAIPISVGSRIASKPSLPGAVNEPMIRSKSEGRSLMGRVIGLSPPPA